MRFLLLWVVFLFSLNGGVFSACVHTTFGCRCGRSQSVLHTAVKLHQTSRRQMYCNKHKCKMCRETDDERQRLAEENLLNRIFSSKVSKQTRPFWEDILRDVCRQRGLWKELLLAKETRQPQKRFLLLPEALGGQYKLQNLCRTLHHSEDDLEYLNPHQIENNESQLKQKSPYILKRHLLSSKSRRPYILKRSI